MGEAKQFKQFEKRVDRINGFEPELELLDDDELRAHADELRERARERRGPRRPAARALRADARGRQAHDGHAPLRRAADRRHGPARRRDRRDEDRRGQDADRDARRRPQLARRPGRPRRHRQRLPRPPRRRVDEADLRHARRRRSACCRTCSPTRRSAPPTPPTSPTAPTPSSASTTCATTWPRRWRRRSSTAGATAEEGKPPLPPFAIVDEVDNILIDEARTPLIISGAPEQAADLYGKFARLAPPAEARQDARGHGPADEEGVRRRLRLRVRREAQDGLGHRAGRRQGRALPRHRPPLPGRERPPRQPPASSR